MLGLLGLAVVAATAFVWFRKIQQVAVPRNRVPFHLSFLAGGMIGLAAIAQGGVVSTVAGVLAAFAGFLFPALRLQSRQQPNEPAVQIGQMMLSASAPDENGVDFDLSSLRGKPYLLKFFRGHW
jgi:hypothetical protein